MKRAPSGAGLLGRESFYWLVGGFSELTIVCRRGFWAERLYVGAELLKRGRVGVGRAFGLRVPVWGFLSQVQ